MNCPGHAWAWGLANLTFQCSGDDEIRPFNEKGEKNVAMMGRNGIGEWTFQKTHLDSTGSRWLIIPAGDQDGPRRLLAGAVVPCTLGEAGTDPFSPRYEPCTRAHTYRRESYGNTFILMTHIFTYNAFVTISRVVSCGERSHDPLTASENFFF